MLNHIRVLMSVFAIAVASFLGVATGVVSADGNPVYGPVEFAPVPGQIVTINPPSILGGGGFSGPFYNLQNGLAGEFTTNILPSEGITIFEVLGVLQQTGTAFVGAVEGTFSTLNGTIVDQHAADLVLIVPAYIPDYAGPALSDGYDAFVAATAVGVVDAGTRAFTLFSRVGGNSDLYLKMEIDFEQMLPPRVVEGSFVFTLN